MIDRRYNYEHPFFLHIILKLSSEGELYSELKIEPYIIYLSPHQPRSLFDPGFDPLAPYTENDIIQGFWEKILSLPIHEIAEFLTFHFDYYEITYIFEPYSHPDPEDFLNYLVFTVWDSYQAYSHVMGFSIERIAAVTNWIKAHPAYGPSVEAKIVDFVTDYVHDNPSHYFLFKSFQLKQLKEEARAVSSAKTQQEGTAGPAEKPTVAVITLYFYYLNEVGYRNNLSSEIKSKHQAYVEAAAEFGISHNTLEQNYNKLLSKTNRVAANQVKNIGAVLDMLKYYPKAYELAKQELLLAEAKM